MSDKIRMQLQAEISPTSIQQIQKQIENMSKTIKPVKIKVDVDKNSLKSVSDINKQVGEIKAPKINMEQINKGMNDFARNTKQAKGQMEYFKNTTSETSGVLATAAVNMGKFMRFYFLGNIVVSFANSIKDGVASIKELDSAMVEVRKVTSETEGTYIDFTNTAFELGKTLGRTGTEVIQATADFARMGFTLAESTVLAKEALLMLNVGDGIENIEGATKSIISTLKGFQVESEDTANATRKINDVYNEVANNFAVSTGDLAEGVRRTSAVMHQAGNSFDQTVALFTGAFEVIQDSSKVSSGLNIITQRLKAMDEEGNKIDGLAPKLEASFNDIGLSLYDTNGELKSTFDNLKALSEIYPTLTKEQQNYIGELVSGKRQAVVLQSIMGNFENIEAAMVSASESTGSAMAENEHHLDSIEGRMGKLTSSSQMFWKNLIDANAIKSMVTGFTNIVDVLDILITNSFSKFILKVAAATTAIVLLNKGVALLGTSMAGTLTGGLLLITAQTQGLTVAMELLGATIITSPLFKVAVAVAGIMAIAGAVKHFTTTLEEQKVKVEELSTEINNLQSEYDQLLGIEDRSPEQQKYLELLYAELSVKRELLGKEKERAIQQEFFNSSGGGNVLTERDTGADKLLRDVEIYKQLHDELNKLKDIDAIKEKKEEILELKESLISQNKTLSDYVNTVGDKAVPEVLALIDALDKLGIVSDTLNESGIGGGVGDGFDEIAHNTEEVAKQYEELAEQFDAVTNKIQTYNGFLEELNSNEGLSAQSKQNIIVKYQELLPYIHDEKLLHEELIAIILHEEEVQRSVYNNMLMHSAEFYNERILGNAQLVDRLNEYYGVEVQNFTSLANAKGQIEAKLINELSGMWAAYYGAVSKGNINAVMQMEQSMLYAHENPSDKDAQAIGKEAGNVLRTFYEIDKMKDTFDGFTIGFKGVDFKGLNTKSAGGGSKSPSKTGGSKTGGSKTGGSTKEEYKAEADAYAKINLELDRNNVLLQLNKTHQDQAGDDIEKKLALMDEEISLTKKRQGLLSDYNTQLRTEAKSLQKDLSSVFTFEGSWEDNSMLITDMENIEGKSKDVEEKFKRVVDIMKELPKGSQEWHNLNGVIEKIAESQSQLYKKQVDDRISNAQNWIEKRNYYDDWGADNEIDAWKRVKAYLEKHYADGKLSHRDYTDSLLQMDKNLEQARKKLWDSVKEMIELEQKNAYMELEVRFNVAKEEIEKLRSTMQSAVDGIEVNISGLQSEIDAIQESERLRSENIERARRLSEISELQNKYYHLQYTNLANMTEAQAKLVGLEKEREQYLERQVKLQELQIKLTNLQNEKNIQQLKKMSDGTWEFEYVADQKAIDDVNKQVESLQKEHDKTLKNLKEQTLGSLQKAQEDYDEWERQNSIQTTIREKQERIKRYQDEIKDMQDHFKEKEEEMNEQFEKEKEALDQYYKDIDELTEIALAELHETFSVAYSAIHDEISGYMDSLMEKHKDLLSTLSQPISMPSPGGGGGGSSSGGGGGFIGYAGGSDTPDTSGTIWMTNPDGRASSVNKDFLDAYLGKGYTIKHDGGIVGDGNKDLPEIANKLFNTKPNEQMVKALKGELFIPEENISKNFLPNLQSLVDDIGFDNSNFSDILKSAVLSTISMAAPKIPQLALSGSSGEIKQNVTIREMVFPNVRDAKEIETSVKTLSTYANQWANRN